LKKLTLRLFVRFKFRVSYVDIHYCEKDNLEESKGYFEQTGSFLVEFPLVEHSGCSLVC